MPCGNGVLRAVTGRDVRPTRRNDNEEGRTGGRTPDAHYGKSNRAVAGHGPPRATRQFRAALSRCDSKLRLFDHKYG